MSDEITIPIDSKKPWQSRTIIGAVITILALVAGFWKIKIDVANLTEIVMQVSGIIGAVLVIYGRWKATQPITFSGKTTPGGPFNPQAEVRKAQRP